MFDVIHQVVYDMGFRPKPESIFYSQSHARKAAYIEAILSAPLYVAGGLKIAFDKETQGYTGSQVKLDLNQPTLWSEISDAVDQLKPYDDQKTMYDRMNFCVVCGTVLVRLVVDVKECPHLHGKVSVRTNKDGYPVIMFEPTEGLEG